MDDFAAEIIGAGGGYRDGQRTPSPEATRHDAAEARQQKGSSSNNSGGGGGLRGSFAALRGKANIQDRLVEK